MFHGDLDDILDELEGQHEEMFIASISRHAALITQKNGSAFLISGDFSGTPEENEAEARRILRGVTRTNRRRRS